MKSLPIALAGLALFTLQASALPAGNTATSPFATNQGPGHAQAFRKAQALKALRKEGLEIQAADGGTLTDPHRAELQRKLDRILAGNY